MSETRQGSSSSKYDDMELRRGPWTLEEDTLLIHYIACHGEGRWNLLARCSGLKRTGKSCRLRWLNYLKPDIKRGNLTPEEQLLILELHSRWGNRWSRIAQRLPGRTDNEIKNYWRTRVQKQARQLKIDANSSLFRDAVRCYWMPRLLEKMDSSQAMQSDASADAKTTTVTPYTTTTAPTTRGQELFNNVPITHQYQLETTSASSYYEPPGPPEMIIPASTSTSTSMAAPSDGVTLNPFMTPSGHSMNAYNNLGTWDSALMSASATCYSTSDYSYTDASDHNYCSSSSSNIGDSLWSMDELCDMLKSYMSGAESNVPFDNS